VEDDDKAKVKILWDAKKSLPADARKTSSVMNDHTGEDPPNEVPQKATTPIEETRDVDEGAGGQFGCPAHMSKKQWSITDRHLVSVLRRLQISSLLDNREPEGSSKGNRSELDSHANTCCAGANTTPFAYSE
jgi:hypothetical protein